MLVGRVCSDGARASYRVSEWKCNVLSRRWSLVLHHKARHRQEGLQGAGRGHQVQGDALLVQRRTGQDGARRPAHDDQEQG